MIQDISPYEFHNEYIDRTPEPEDIVFVFDGRSVLCASGLDEDRGPTRFPTFAELQDGGAPQGSANLQDGEDLHERLRYLFRISEQSYFLLMGDAAANEDAADPAAGAEEPAGFSFVPLMALRSKDNVVPAFASLTAFHLYTWYSKNRFCGKCGGARLVHDKNERMLKCPVCGNMVFPTIAPAVIVGVRWGEKLLMTKYAGREYGGWALIAGFCEIGEDVEDTVHREVMEEAGVHVKNLQYVDSQPWGSDSNLLMGYFCEVDGDAHIHMDEVELARAQWVDRADIPDMSDNISLTGHMIELFRKGKA